MTHVMEAKTLGNEKPQPVSWGLKGGCVALSQEEPNNKHTLLQGASVAQVTKVPEYVTTKLNYLGSLEVLADNPHARSSLGGIGIYLTGTNQILRHQEFVLPYYFDPTFFAMFCYVSHGKENFEFTRKV